MFIRIFEERAIGNDCTLYQSSTSLPWYFVTLSTLFIFQSFQYFQMLADPERSRVHLLSQFCNGYEETQYGKSLTVACNVSSSVSARLQRKATLWGYSCLRRDFWLWFYHQKFLNHLWHGRTVMAFSWYTDAHTFTFLAYTIRSIGSVYSLFPLENFRLKHWPCYTIRIDRSNGKRYISVYPPLKNE